MNRLVLVLALWAVQAGAQGHNIVVIKVGPGVDWTAQARGYITAAGQQGFTRPLFLLADGRPAPPAMAQQYRIELARGIRAIRSDPMGRVMAGSTRWGRSSAYYFLSGGRTALQNMARAALGLPAFLGEFFFGAGVSEANAGDELPPEWLPPEVRQEIERQQGQKPSNNLDSLHPTMFEAP